jgi:hypothetical protein
MAVSLFRIDMWTDEGGRTDTDRQLSEQRGRLVMQKRD